MSRAKAAQAAIRKLANPAQAQFCLKFFKTGPGEYGEGDKFLGISVPPIRALAREFRDLSLEEVRELLRSPYHEERLFALVLLMHVYKKSDEKTRERIYRLYLAEREHLNNWDLIDVSVAHIVGAHLYETPKDRAILYKYARSGRMWDRRIAIISTFYFLRKGELDDSLKLAEELVHDEEDLMHKAVGWTLREVGKRDKKRLVKFLEKHAATMPRTMLRYALEKFSPKARVRFMKAKSRATRAKTT